MSHAPLNDYAVVGNTEPLQPKQSRIISTVLSPAIRLWLRSQVEQVEDLQVNIQAGDRLLLTGNIPKVILAAKQAVYQGLHLRQIRLVAQAIRVNLGQVLKGKPLRLLAPVPVTGEIMLTQADLQASLASTLLPSALTEFLVTLLAAGGFPSPAEFLKHRQITWQEIAINSGKIQLKGMMANCQATASVPILIRAAVKLASSNELQLTDTEIEGPFELNSASLNGMTVNLGSDVEIQELTLNSGELLCRGQLLVRTD